MDSEECNDVLNHSSDPSIAELEGNVQQRITKTSDLVDSKVGEENISEEEVENDSKDASSCSSTSTGDDDSDDDDDDSKGDNVDTTNFNNDSAIVSDEYMSNDSEDECAVFFCNECGKKFKNGASLKAHLAKKHNPRALVNCELCDSKYRGDFIEHLESEHSSGDGSYYCKKCNIICGDYAAISKHRHEKGINNVCKQCGRVYKSKENYKLHLLIHNNDGDKKKNVKQFNCETCGKEFLLASLLKDHINLHKGLKPYLCRICGCSFAQNATLKQHFATHSSLRPYKCAECNRAFYRKGDLRKHMRIHLGEQSFVCNACGDTFPQSSYIRSQIDVHKDVQLHICVTCDKSYSKRDIVKLMRLHALKKAYSCKECGKCFSNSFNLATHKKKFHSIVSNKIDQSSVPLAV
ncbi:uncharacterized protein isoform X1 [Rhodnius prolixus]